MQQQIGKVIEAMSSKCSTDLDEPYILTPEEEQEVIGNAKKAFLANKAATLAALGYKIQQIEIRLAEYSTQEIFSEMEIEKLLATSNSNKHQAIWHEEQRRKRNEAEATRKEKLRIKCDATHFLNLMKNNSERKPLINNNDNRNLINALCFFFSNDKFFEGDLGYDLNKGLWIRGGAGVGKTFLLTAIRNNELNKFKIHSMIEVAQEVKYNGEYVVPGEMIVLDDVGSEEATVNHYGTKINWFKEFIELYYAERKPFNKLIITTNCSFDEIEEKYGFRVRSRIREMFNVIDVKGEDLRGRK